MNVVGKVSSLISQGVYSVATPFHPFGGAVDIIVVQQQDGSFRSTPWYVRFGKFQGVLKGTEKMVRIGVNGVEANFHMYLDNSGEAYFVREVDSSKESKTDGFLKDLDNLEVRSDYDGNLNDRNESIVGICRLEHSVSESGAVQLQDEFGSSDAVRFDRSESDVDRKFYDFQDEQSSQEGSVDLSEYGSGENFAESQGSNSEVVLVSVDGHVLTAPLSASEQNTENVQLDTPQFHLGPGEGPDFGDGNEEFGSSENAWASGYIGDVNTSTTDVIPENVFIVNGTTISSSIGLGLEACNGEGEHASGDKKSHHVRDHEGDDIEEAYLRVKREDVFKSCLELSELANQDGSMESDIRGSPAEVQTSQEKVTESLPSVAETEEDQKSEVQKGHDVTPSLSLSRTSVDLQADSGSVSNEMLEKDLIEAVSLPNNRETNDEQNGLSVVDEAMATSPEGLQKEDGFTNSLTEEPLTANSHQGDGRFFKKLEISLCQNELHAGMGLDAAAKVFDAHRVSAEEFMTSMTSIVNNENLVVRYKERYLSWDKAAPVVLGLAAFGLDLPVELNDTIPVELEEIVKPMDNDSDLTPTSSGRRWRLWPIPFRRVKTLQHESSNSSTEETFLDPEPSSQNLSMESPSAANLDVKSPHKQLIRTNVPTSEQIATLNLQEGQNVVTFSFSTRVLGKQKVDAHIYLWKWNARIVISDVDGTITKSDVLGQFMPLVGKDWTQSGVARLFSAIKENGYQLLFLSARAIVQAYLTRSFLLNLKQDGKALPNGPVVISPDGLFPSLYREVIRRAPHEFKIACLEDIRALFPADYNPFYAGFGNRDTDELSYRKIGIPKGKIFIINPKGEVAISHRIDVRSYTSLHTLVNDMFPPTSLVEQEDYNSWNFWRVPLPDIDIN